MDNVRLVARIAARGLRKLEKRTAWRDAQHAETQAALVRREIREANYLAKRAAAIADYDAVLARRAAREDLLGPRKQRTPLIGSVEDRRKARIERRAAERKARADALKAREALQDAKRARKRISGRKLPPLPYSKAPPLPY